MRITILDRYIMGMVALFVGAAVFAFTVLIICNNFYASSDLLFEKKIPFGSVALINILDAPATIVLSLPVATLFGVMLAIGQLGRQSEITAMRCSGISLFRIVVPILILSIFLSIATYFIDEHAVPAASQRAYDLKKALKGDTERNIEQNVFLRNNEGIIIWAGNYDTEQRILSRVTVYEKDDRGWTRMTTSFGGNFQGDQLVLITGQTFVFDENGEMRYKENIADFRRTFPRTLQEVHKQKRDASTLAAGEMAEEISRSREAGQDPIKYETDLQFKYATSVACFIFSFVGFMFSVFSPRKETFVGMLYAIILVLIYYVLISVFKSLGKQGIIPYPLISAWATNVIYFALGIYIFARVQR